MPLGEKQRQYLECEMVHRELKMVHTNMDNFMNQPLTEVIFTLEERSMMEGVVEMIKNKSDRYREDAGIVLMAIRLEKNND